MFLPTYDGVGLGYSSKHLKEMVSFIWIVTFWQLVALVQTSQIACTDYVQSLAYQLGFSLTFLKNKTLVV